MSSLYPWAIDEPPDVKLVHEQPCHCDECWTKPGRENYGGPGTPVNMGHQRMTEDLWQAELKRVIERRDQAVVRLQAEAGIRIEPSAIKVGRNRDLRAVVIAEREAALKALIAKDKRKLDKIERKTKPQVTRVKREGVVPLGFIAAYIVLILVLFACSYSETEHRSHELKERRERIAKQVQERNRQIEAQLRAIIGPPGDPGSP